MARTRTASPHAEWLSLLDISGPFLSLPVLNDAFPQGIDTDTQESEIARRVRRAYTDEWLPNRALSRPSVALQTEWIDFVLGEVLEWPSGLVAAGQSLPPGLEAAFPEYGETLRPTRALLNPTDRDGGKARVLVAHYPPEQELDAPLRDERIRWKASPATRMTELLHATRVRVGLVTNGEQWLLVNAPAGEPTGLISWYAHLWLEERARFRRSARSWGATDSSACRTTKPLKGSSPGARKTRQRSRPNSATRCARRSSYWSTPSTERTVTGAAHSWRG
ncbi:MAG: hypothetical protein M3R38_12215 [Actinomycetota bacterium]|nr:hypothetical protein [Actinomycetota bacterium]